MKKIIEIERSKMPQVRGRDIEEILSIFDEWGIEYSKEKIKCDNLKATQEDCDQGKINRMKVNIRTDKYNPAPLFISKDEYILDGHHIWLALKKLYGNNYKVSALNYHALKDVDSCPGRLLTDLIEFQ